MAGSERATGTVPVVRAELDTQDMDLIAGVIRDLYAEHAATFRCPDPGHVDGRVRSATAGGLNAALSHYDGFTYTAEVDPGSPPLAVACTRGSGVLATAREDLRLAPGDVLMIPDDLPSQIMMDHGEYATLQAPWAATRSLAEETTGMPAANLRFESMAPVSAARQRTFARTAELICDELVASGAAEVDPLIAQEMTRITAAAFLETFPNTTMTISYVPDPGWVAPPAVRRAAAFIDAQAGLPVTLDEVAEEAGVNGRTLQHAFSHYFGTTPADYLRRVRLERAHQELAEAEPGNGATVAAIARRWGWSSPGQFTVAYQDRFGVLPTDTLGS